MDHDISLSIGQAQQPLMTPEEEAAKAGLVPGRIVHYILPSGPKKGEHRAALVVRVWGPTCVNLRVFLDGTNDYDYERLPHFNAASGLPHDLWVTSASAADPAEGVPGSWHHIERA